MSLTLIEKAHEAADIWTFRFRSDEPLVWEAGQFVRVELPHDDPDDEGTTRWFTNSAAPFEGVTDWLSLNALSEARYLEGMMKESLRLHARAAAVRGRETANAFHGAPRTLIREGDPGWAMHLLSMAGRLAPQDPCPWLRGAEILLELGLLPRAVEWLEQAGKRAPGEEGIDRLLEAARSAP